MHSLPDTQNSGGPQTIGLGGAASLMSLQSESTVHGYCARLTAPQPNDVPPGVQLKASDEEAQSAFV
jgi:hypothetical protein